VIEGEPALPIGGGAGRSIMSAIGLTTLATAISYALALAQQALYARVLGVNIDTDALGAALAWAVGTTGLVGTTLSTVFLPLYVRTMREGADAAIRTRRRATQLTLLAGAALGVATFVGAPSLAQLLVPGANDAQVLALTDLIRLAAPLELTWLLVWLAVATVNAHERYVLAGASFALPPIPVILLLLSGAASPALVVVGYIAGTLVQLAALWSADPGSRPTLARAGGAARVELGRGLLPVGIAFALLNAIPLEIRGLASFHGAGAVASADYASRLVLAGQQLLLSGLLAVTFTRWSGTAAREDQDGLFDSVDRTLVLVLAAGIATTIVLPLLAVWLVSMLLVGGRFSGADAATVGTFVAWMAPGVGGHMVLMVALRALLAQQRYRPVLVAAGAATALALTGAFLGQTSLGLNGVATAYSLAYVAAGAVAFASVWRHLARATDGAPRLAPARGGAALGRPAPENHR